MAKTKSPWHYISKEGYPKKEGQYLVVCFTKSGHPSYTVETFYTNMQKASGSLPRKKGFCWDSSEWGSVHDDWVSAWMDIPEVPPERS